MGNGQHNVLTNFIIYLDYFQANQLLPFLTERLSYLKRPKARVQRVLGY